MINRDAAEKIIELMKSISSELREASKIVEKNSDDDDQETYAATIEFVIGYLQQDVMRPIIEDYPDLAPKGWS